MFTLTGQYAGLQRTAPRILRTSLTLPTPELSFWEYEPEPYWWEVALLHDSEITLWKLDSKGIKKQVMPIYEKNQCEWGLEPRMALRAANVSFRRYLQ